MSAIVSGAAGRPARTLRIVLGCLVLFAACNPIRGCAESQFELAPDSRLPTWFTLPASVPRANVEVTLTYYSAPLIGEPRATVTMRIRGSRISNQVVATLRGEPQTLGPSSGSGRIPYPMYEILTANGITEIIEHRRMEPIFYISDDPEVRRKLGIPEGSASPAGHAP